MSDNERVLCVQTMILEMKLKAVLAARPAGSKLPAAFFPASEVPLDSIVSVARSTWDGTPIFLERNRCENDKDFRQLATYSLLTDLSRGAVSYERGQSGAEQRLHALNSIGWGGHIEESDIDNTVTSESLELAANREIDEEISLVRYTEPVAARELKREYFGLICVMNTDNMVDLVHCGLVFLYAVDGLLVHQKEDSQKNPVFKTWQALQAMRDQDILESWSKVLVDYMSIC